MADAYFIDNKNGNTHWALSQLAVLNQVLLFDAIFDHKRDETAMTKSDQTFVGVNGREYFRQSTRGWKFCILWKDGSTPWEKLSDFKECYPVETAEYATA